MLADRADAEGFVDRLIEMGYLKFVADSAKDTVRGKLIDAVQHGCLHTGPEEELTALAAACADKRLYYTDGEGLAEGIAEGILGLQEVLQREGCRIDTVEDLGAQAAKEHASADIGEQR